MIVLFLVSKKISGFYRFDWGASFSYSSSETSSYTSECQDDEEIALAIQAAELAARREARARFKSSADLIHRLFVCVSGKLDALSDVFCSFTDPGVRLQSLQQITRIDGCISGVADQLQTNYASDLRHILKAVFECNASEPYIPIDVATATDNQEEPNQSSDIQTETSPAAPEPELSGEAEVDVPTEGAVEADETITSSPRRDNRDEASTSRQTDEAGKQPL